MTFTIHGMVGGREAAVHWDGHSYAKPWLMDIYLKYLAMHKGEFIGFQPDAGATADYDKTAPAAYAAWMAVFDEVSARSGDFPWEKHEKGEVY